MTAITGLLALVACALAQMFLPALPFMVHTRPPALLSLVLYYALNRSPAVYLTFAFLAGLANDSLSMVPQGFSSLVYMALGAAAARARETVQTDSAVTHAVFGCAASLCAALATEIALVNGGLLSARFEWLWLRLFWSAALGVLCAPVVFLAMAGLDRSVGILREGEQNP